MKHDFKEELTKLLAESALQEMQLNVASQLTAIDIYVGDDHLRIACRIDAVDQIMEDVVQMIRIPGEMVMCHEAINLDDCFVDYTKYPMVRAQWHIRHILKKHFGLVRIFECTSDDGCYLKTTGYGLASEFAKIHECSINKYLTKL